MSAAHQESKPALAVLGAGMAGLSAAYEAAQRGARSFLIGRRLRHPERFNRLTAHPFGRFDACAAVHERKPRVISEVALDVPACGLDRLYRPTPFPGIHLRRPDVDPRP